MPPPTCSIRMTSGRTREVRIWITAAIALWALRAIVRDVEVALGFTGVPAFSDLPIIGLAICAGAAYMAALRGHLRANDQIALYLDATILFAATAALMLTLFGPGVASAGDAVHLTYAIFFLSTFGATLLLDLAIRAMARCRLWSEVASLMEQYVKSQGFYVVEKFVGHGIGQNMHEEPGGNLKFLSNVLRLTLPPG